jgi:hypothetical protein
MLDKINLIPTTKASYPFITAEFHCKLSEKGYVEDEYFMSGTANVYTEDENNMPEVIFSGAPYTTRLLVRRPININSFSGNVVIEILNASAMMDIDRMWVNSWEYFTRNGDIYVGITSKGHVVDSLKRFDPVRYEPINWANPMPERTEPEAPVFFGFLPQYESGLFWDMLIDLGKLLRSDSEWNPLKCYGQSFLYLTGWSQSCGYVARYINSFALGGSLFDGYMSAGGGADMAPINAYEPLRMNRRKGIPAGSLTGTREPFIAINTESENRLANWVDDYDQPDFKFRTYQIAASSHDSKYNLLDYYEGQGVQDCKRACFELTFEGAYGEPLDNPYEYVFNAAWRNLYAWTRQGIPAPHAPKIETEITSVKDTDVFGARMRNRTDALGNAMGGIRTPGADYPVGVYASSSKKSDGTYQIMFGNVQPFSVETLKGLYAGMDNYRRLVTQKTDEMIALGFLLKEDRAAMIETTVGLAKKRGL